jgi:hypothetical protein
METFEFPLSPFETRTVPSLAGASEAECISCGLSRQNIIFWQPSCVIAKAATAGRTARNAMGRTVELLNLMLALQGNASMTHCLNAIFDPFYIAIICNVWNRHVRKDW